MTIREERRALAWREMDALAASGLGQIVEVSPARRKLMLNLQHPRSALLSDRPEADGFIRADEDSLLVRDASAAVLDAIPRQLLQRRMASAKGLEFKWTTLSGLDVIHICHTVAWLADTGGLGPTSE